MSVAYGLHSSQWYLDLDVLGAKIGVERTSVDLTSSQVVIRLEADK